MNDTDSAGSKKRSGQKLSAPILIITAAVLSALLFFPFITCLDIGGECFLRIKKGDFFEIDYIHSANRSPVRDIIEWTGKEMTVRESVYKTFGAGIPIPSDGIGESLVKTDEGYVLTGINKSLGLSFTVMTEEIPNHRVVYKDKDISLNEIFGIRKIVKLSIDKKSIYSLFLN